MAKNTGGARRSGTPPTATQVSVSSHPLWLPRPTTQSTLAAFASTRQRPAVRVVDAATRAAEEDPRTARIERRIPQPKFAVKDGGCRDCGHLARTHETGYQGRRVPCKSVDCDCTRFLGPLIDWPTVVVLAIFAVALVGTFLALVNA